MKDVREVVHNWTLYRFLAFFKDIVDTQLVELLLKRRCMLLNGPKELGPGRLVIFDSLGSY